MSRKLYRLNFSRKLAPMCNESGPIIVEEPDSRVDVFNSSGANIRCTVRGHPKPSVVWVRAEDGTAVSDFPGLRRAQSGPRVVVRLQVDNGPCIYETGLYIASRAVSRSLENSASQHPVVNEVFVLC
ncbi:Down syndrome cell adhesion molecule-like protein Dscam2 [Portunus trituberculatus]|uniref:Down syndrome cell adhesion molecule-like protein Dscam2 n=1 Tax=Portunus trituberculatus TaxID=210409 RepID=A0A5B7IQ20_PORTR|nr:Down syndrome cell adhesion molecule-like protein Dscam2 [Portunus trituberculatus]